MANVDYDVKTLSKGSQCPSLAPNELYVYNMRFCPYAERALIALSLKNLSHKVINIDLKEKPEWYLEKKNPLGKVPAIEKEGKVVYESLVCAEYVDALYPDSSKRLLPADPFEAAKQKMLLERLSQVVSLFYGMYKSSDPKELLEGLARNEALMAGDFFAGAKPGYADYMIFPWYERLPAVELFTASKFSLQNRPKTQAYIKRMLALPEIARVARSNELHAKFMKSMVDGKPDYDAK